MATISPTNSATAASLPAGLQPTARPGHCARIEPFASRLGRSVDLHSQAPRSASPDPPVRPAGDALDREGERSGPAPQRIDTDPLVRTLAQLGTPWAGPQEAAPAPGAPDPIAFARMAPIEQVVTELVRRIAWSGDARTGTARIEIGSGALAGATLLVQADAGVVHVSLRLPPGADERLWRERIGARLERRGLHVGSVDVS